MVTSPAAAGVQLESAAGTVAFRYSDLSNWAPASAGVV